MEATYECRRCRKGVLSPTNTTTYCCCKNISSSHPSWEAKVTYRGCKPEFPLPPRTTAYRCSASQNVSNSILGFEKSRENRGICRQMKKIGAKLFRHDHVDSAYKSGNLQSMSSPSAGSSSSSLSSRSNKRAVLCGVSYTKRKFRLKGTVNDIKNMRNLLVNNFRFPNECIRVLTEQEQNADLIPTKQNIVESLRWLVKDCQPGDSLVFYFSGHGLQQPDLKEDEIDGFDETLCPVDFIKEGMIVDNDINSTIVWPLEKGVTLHAIVDACHSGTILDLEYVYNQDNGFWDDNKPPAKEPIRKHTNGGLAICLSACADSQMAADTTAFGGKGMNGAMTYIFTKAIRDNPGITYGLLLEKMHEEIEKINQSRCHNSILQRMFQRKISQDPLLSSSEKFDVSRRTFAL